MDAELLRPRVDHQLIDRIIRQRVRHQTPGPRAQKRIVMDGSRLERIPGRIAIKQLEHDGVDTFADQGDLREVECRAPLPANRVSGRYELRGTGTCIDFVSHAPDLTAHVSGSVPDQNDMLTR